jgi:hypothetical protein
MCFSETASLTVGAGLCVTGVATVGMVRNPHELPLALVPLLFGVQQLTEAVVWHNLGDGPNHYAGWAVTAFLAFALPFWPAFVPIATLTAEPRPERRRWMWTFVALGLLVAVPLAVAVARGGAWAHAQEHRIVYHLPHVWPNIPGGHWAIDVLPYIVAACASTLLSSIGTLRAFGIVAIATALISEVAYDRAFVSVWCFMAAVLSLLLVLHFVHLDDVGRRYPRWPKRLRVGSRTVV